MCILAFIWATSQVYSVRIGGAIFNSLGLLHLTNFVSVILETQLCHLWCLQAIFLWLRCLLDYSGSIWKHLLQHRGVSSMLVTIILQVSCTASSIVVWLVFNHYSWSKCHLAVAHHLSRSQTYYYVHLRSYISSKSNLLYLLSGPLSQIAMFDIIDSWFYTSWVYKTTCITSPWIIYDAPVKMEHTGSPHIARQKTYTSVFHNYTAHSEWYLKINI
jgi:hypothetical protein